MTTSVRLQAEAFNPGIELNQFSAKLSAVGAIASFLGVVRSTPDKPLTALTLEHYPALAQSQLEQLAQAAMTRFEVNQITIIHRYGTLKPNEPIVLVLTASAHRHAAQDAVSFVMDVLKTDAPFWKKEHFAGHDEWVDARAEDDDARAKWDHVTPENTK